MNRLFKTKPDPIFPDEDYVRLVESKVNPLKIKRKATTEPNPQDMADKVLLLKINQLEDKVDTLSDLIRQLMADRYPKYVGTREACRILGISGTTMDKRLKAGYYTFAIKENNRWRFPLPELYRFQGQL